jgi:D-proline reductase (dithiol) PrdB
MNSVNAGSTIRQVAMDASRTSPARDGPTRTPAPGLNEWFAGWISNTPSGASFGRWLSRTIARPQLRRLTTPQIPWTPFHKPLAQAVVTLVTTGGVHLRSDRTFNLDGDPTYRVIPKHARPGDLAISHQAYDRTDALRDINLVFPIERLRELERERVIGTLTAEHYGFGLMGSAKRLMPAIKEVAKRIAESHVDLVLLVPA